MSKMNDIAQEVIDRQDECARLRAELASARDTIKRLNKRAQSAEAALCDLKKVLDRLAANTEKGTPWVGGSLGRAFLAHFNSQLTTENTALRKVAEALEAYVADWDSQVSDPRAACYQCEDPEHIKQFRAALAEWRSK